MQRNSENPPELVFRTSRSKDPIPSGVLPKLAHIVAGEMESLASRLLEGDADSS